MRRLTILVYLIVRTSKRARRSLVDYLDGEVRLFVGKRRAEDTNVQEPAAGDSQTVMEGKSTQSRRTWTNVHMP